MANLVLIETASNQRYIFATNKRRENVGASQLIHQAGMEWVPKDHKHRVLTLSSGKALIQVDNAATGRAVVESVTRRALREAPGLDVYGMVGDDVDLTTTSLHDASTYLHRDAGRARSGRPGPELRFLRLPIVDECASSGLPATRLWSDPGGEVSARSAVSLAKLEGAKAGLNRLGGVIGVTGKAMGETIDYLEDRCEWVAVIHADGNGVGALFTDLDRRVVRRPAETIAAYNDRYAAALRSFSRAVADCTEESVRAAYASYRAAALDEQDEAQGFLPLVVGGDDVTLVCDGKFGIKAAKSFLDTFGAATKAHPDIGEIAPGGLGACAGIAIVKPHFPFSLAYDLAAELTASAKQMKPFFPDNPFSALDFHVMYDASGGDLADIRRKLVRRTAGSREQLFGRPLVTEAAPDADAIVEQHRWARFVERTEVLRQVRLPSSQAHALRQSLFVGRDFADSRFQRLLDRYDGIEDLGGDRPGSLFWEERHPDRDLVWVTGLLDALECQGLLA